MTSPALPRRVSRPFRRPPRRFVVIPTLAFVVGAAVSWVAASPPTLGGVTAEQAAALDAEVAAALERVQASACAPSATTEPLVRFSADREAREAEASDPARLVAGERARLARALAPSACPSTWLDHLVRAATVEAGTAALIEAARDPRAGLDAARAADELARTAVPRFDLDASLDRERDLTLLQLAPAVRAPLTRPEGLASASAALAKHRALRGLCPPTLSAHRCAQALERHDGGPAAMAARGWLDARVALAELPAEVARASRSPR